MAFITIDSTKCFECGSPAIENHHIVPKSEGGTRTLPLCQKHHYMVHGKDGTGKEMSAGHLVTKALERKSPALRLGVGAAFMCLMFDDEPANWGISKSQWYTRKRRAVFLAEHFPEYLEEILVELQKAIGSDVDMMKYWTYRNDEIMLQQAMIASANNRQYTLF